MKTTFKNLALFAALAAALSLSNCTAKSSPTEPADTNNNQQHTATGGAHGTLTLRSGGQPGQTVNGTITVTIDTVTRTIQASGTVGADTTITLDYTFTGLNAGRAAVVYTGDLTVGGHDTLIAGYATVQVVLNEDANVDSSAFTIIAVNPSFTPTGVARVDTLYTLLDTVTAPNTVISATVSNMDLCQVFVYVNGNAFPVIIAPSSGGVATLYQVSVTLDPGMNTIVLTAMNSTGRVAQSRAIHVYCNLGSLGSYILGTLIWDSPTSDMDLHLFYYTNSTPNFSSAATAHCYWMHTSILPDSVGAYTYKGTLDLDKTNGQGPEHMLVKNFPDGYYVFAINSFSMHSDAASRCTFTIDVGTTQQQTMSYVFTTGVGLSYSNLVGWVRCFDVRVLNGTATILTPDSTFVYSSAVVGLPKAVVKKPY